MKMRRAVLLLMTAMILSSAPFASAQQRETDRPTDRPAFPIATAQESEQYHRISVVGRLMPKSRIVHYATTGGYVSEISVEEGRLVEAGQKLFSIRRKDDVSNIYKPTIITARITGWVSRVYVQTEDEVGSGDPAVVVIGTEGYVLEATISDKDAFKVRIGGRVSATTMGEQQIRGVLVSRSREPDYDTGLFSLTFHFPNDQLTHIGEFVMIDLPTDRSKGIFVRRDLLRRRYGKYYLWTVTEQKTLSAREVVIGPTYDELVKIEEGLSAGEKYLTRITGREKEGAVIDASEN